MAAAAAAVTATTAPLQLGGSSATQLSRVHSCIHMLFHTQCALSAVFAKTHMTQQSEQSNTQVEGHVHNI
jgi:hypothetical protein